jgi:hypothetical protein
MTQPDERIRESLRDLIPGYQGPADPYARVGVAIRRRRSRQRMLIAISSVAVAAALTAVAVVPLALRGRLPGTHGSGRGGVTPAKVSQQVAAGTVAGGDWAVQAVKLASGARRCLYADDAVFQAAALCFDAWPPNGRVSWGTVAALRPDARVTAIFGVAASTVGSVIVLLSNGSQQQVPAVPSPDLPDTHFFALVLATPGLKVRSVTTLAADGTLNQLAATAPGTPPCVPGPTTPCTAAAN